MQPMHQVKLPPLGNREWAENGMIQNLGVGPELRFALGHDPIHLCDPGPNFIQDLLTRHPSRTRDRGRFPTGWQIAQTRHNQSLRALLQTWRVGLRLARFEDAPQSFRCPRIGQTKMLDRGFRRSTTCREGASLVARPSVLVRLTRSLLSGVRDEGPRGLLIFSALSVRMLPHNKPKTYLYHEGCHEDG